MEELESRLKSFDWWFSMADDPRCYKEGSLAYDRLQEYMKSLPDQEAVGDLYKKHCPWGK